MAGTFSRERTFDGLVWKFWKIDFFKIGNFAFMRPLRGWIYADRRVLWIRLIVRLKGYMLGFWNLVSIMMWFFIGGLSGEKLFPDNPMKKKNVVVVNLYSEGAHAEVPAQFFFVFHRGGFFIFSTPTIPINVWLKWQWVISIILSKITSCFP